MKALLHSHIAFDIITSPGLVASELSDYSVLYAPLLIAMSDAEATIITNWVNAGGLLIVV